MRRRAAGSVRAALGPGAASIEYASCGEVAASCLHRSRRAFAARNLTLRDAFALLVPMRTLSCALRQWFAGQSRSAAALQLPAAAELIASTAAKGHHDPRCSAQPTAKVHCKSIGLDNLSYDAAKLHCH